MRWLWLVCLLLAVDGCGYDHYGLLPGGGPTDGAVDAPIDGGGVGADAAVDAAVDARVDATVDAAVDAAVDATVDANPCGDPDTDPLCPGATLLGDVSGDTASMALVASGATEAWYQVNVVENDDGALEPVTAQVDLVSPPGVDFDLIITCASCTDTRIVSSSNGPGMTDTLFVGRSDVAFTDVGFTVFVEIRWIAATMCGNWSLTVTGDVDTTERPCN